MPIQTLKWEDDALVLLDQTRLPGEVTYLSCKDVETVAEAIRELRVRGAPAIGVAAAYGAVIGAREGAELEPAAFRTHVADSMDRLAGTRPTAVNLFWALNQMRRVLEANSDANNHQICARVAGAGARNLRSRSSCVPAAGSPRSRPIAGRTNGDNALQCRQPRNGGLWNGAGSHLPRRPSKTKESRFSPTKRDHCCRGPG